MLLAECGGGINTASGINRYDGDSRGTTTMRTELIKATELTRSHDPASVDEVLRLLQNTVYSFSMKVCGHPEDAQDTMQEVLLRVLPHLKKIQEPKALAVWLYTVARNHCWRMRRKSVYAPQRTLSLDELMPDETEMGHLLQSSADSPEEQVLEQEQNQLLHRAILSIPPQYRIVLVLHDMEDLGTELTAKVLGLKPGTVRVRLHRARLAVRKAMARLLDREATAALGGFVSALPAGSKPESRSQACREIFANLSEYMDGTMQERTCEEMRGHIEACPSCVAFIRDLQQAIDRCRHMQVVYNDEVASKMRTLLTREYLRLLETATAEKGSLSV